MKENAVKRLPQWIIDSQQVFAFIAAPDGKIEETNHLFDKIFITGKAIYNKGIEDFFSTGDVLRLKEIFNDLKHEKVRNNTCFVASNEFTNSCKWEFSLLTGEGGIKSIIGIASKPDNADKETAGIGKNEAWFDAFFINNSPASAWITDEDGVMLMTNKMHKEFSGKGPEEESKTLWDIFPKKMADLYYSNNQKVLDLDETLITEENFIDKYGINRTFLVYKFPLKTYNDKRLIGGWSIDITDKKIAEQKIFEHNLKLREIAFLQSHEVRRPLANILGLIELIGTEYEEKRHEQRKEYLYYLSLSARELDEVIRKVINKVLE